MITSIMKYHKILLVYDKDEKIYEKTCGYVVDVLILPNTEVLKAEIHDIGNKY